MSRISQAAQQAAAKICGIGGCFCGYYEVCSNPQTKLPNPRPQIGCDKECPLAKYNVEPTPKPTTREEIVASWANRPSLSDCAVLCKDCQYGATREEWEVYRSHCMDCPVHQTSEAIQENEAEARCS